MTNGTWTAVKAVLSADSTCDPEQIEAARKALTRKTVKPRVLLTTRQVAELLNCHPETVRRYGRSGVLNSIRRNVRTIRWDRDEVIYLRDNGGGDAA